MKKLINTSLLTNVQFVTKPKLARVHETKNPSIGTALAVKYSIIERYYYAFYEYERCAIRIHNLKMHVVRELKM
jgi:hypothetical protein